MADFAVSTAFTAKDRVSKAFSKMNDRAGKFGKGADAAFRKASRSASKFQGITKSILSSVVVVSLLASLAIGVKKVATEFIDFDQAITSASAKFKGLNLATAQGQATLLKLGKTARQVGADTQFSAGQAAAGLDFLAMAGFNAEQSIAALPGVVDLATVANIDLARSTDIASDSLGAFNLMTEDATQLQKNFTRLNDVMALTMSRTNTNIESMFEAIQKGAPTFTAAGQSLETFNALLGVMANSGVKGGEAGTSLRNVMLRLAKPTKESAAVLEDLNVKTQDAQGNFKDVVDIIADFEKGLKGMGSAQRSAALVTVFGARAVTGMNILLAEGTDKIRGFRKELISATGSSKQMADVMRQSIGNRLKALGSAAIEVGFKFFQAFEKDGSGALETLTNAVRNFDPTPIINGLKLAVQLTGMLFKVIEPFIPILPVLVGGWLAYAAALKGLAIAQAVTGFLSMIAATQGAVTVMGILNAVMAANPLGAIIIGITAVVALLVLLERKFGILSKLWDKIKSVGSVVGAALGFGDEQKRDERRVPPNKAEAEAKRQIGFEGRLDIAGAPEGSTITSKTVGAPPIDMQLLGAN